MCLLYYRIANYTIYYHTRTGELNNTQNNNDSDNSNSSDDENQKVSGRKRKRSEILDEEMDITVMEPTSKRLKQFYINLIRRHYS